MSVPLSRPRIAVSLLTNGSRNRNGALIVQGRIGDAHLPCYRLYTFINATQVSKDSGGHTTLWTFLNSLSVKAPHVFEASLLLNVVSLIKHVQSAWGDQAQDLDSSIQFHLVDSPLPVLPAERFLDQTFIRFIYLSFQIHVRLKFDKLAFHVLIPVISGNVHRLSQAFASVGYVLAAVKQRAQSCRETTHLFFSAVGLCRSLLLPLLTCVGPFLRDTILSTFRHPPT